MQFIMKGSIIKNLAQDLLGAVNSWTCSGAAESILHFWWCHPTKHKTSCYQLRADKQPRLKAAGHCPTCTAQVLASCITACISNIELKKALQYHFGCSVTLIFIFFSLALQPHF